jgi:hypothetical protein
MKNAKVHQGPSTHRLLIPVLIVIISLGIGLSVLDGSAKAESGQDLIIEAVNPQPVMVKQGANEMVASFTIQNTTDKVVDINSLSFYPKGNSQKRILRNSGLYRISLQAGGKVLGHGQQWIFDFGRVYQEVTLDSLLSLNPKQLVSIDVYADLRNRDTTTFGVDLIGLSSKQSVTAQLPAIGRLYLIRRHY